MNTNVEPKKKKGVALAGVAAGTTAVCTVGHTGNDLHYRGYDILDLAKFATFEEVAYLLIYGNLPSQNELDAYKENLKKLRDIPKALKEILEKIPKNAHPMDVMRTACSALGTLEQESLDRNIKGTQLIGDRLISCFPGILIYWYHFSHSGKRISL
ncbi:MAG TPA: 2-methylcitrate synthase, partial [Methylophilaceae bacterium]|nr:2-methylcitrate synthase [Methylophilaceae bacterium]